MPSGVVRASVELRGFRELRTKLKQDPPFYSPSVRRLMQSIGERAAAEVRRSAPRGETGATASQVVIALQQKPMPLWVRVKDTARAKGRAAKRQNARVRAGLAAPRLTKGYPYPARLNYDPKYRTHGWFTRAIRRAQSQVASLLRDLGNDVERSWTH